MEAPTFSNCSQVELSNILAKQRRAQMQDPLPDWAVRSERLRRVRSLITENRREIGEAINRDFSHRPQAETDLLEIFPVIGGIDHAVRHGRKWMKPQGRKTGRWFKPASSVLLPQPVGIVGIVVPWNYPLFLAIGPLTSALVAGNRAMLKLPELTPAFSSLFANLCRRYFDETEIAVINGDANVARTFVKLQFDHILFTGSTAIGREVMRAASTNLTPVTLELGGKSPAFIDRDANFDNAAAAILRGKLFNAGQTCIAPDYVLVPKGRELQFVESARKVFTKLHPAHRQLGDYTDIISPLHYDRLSSLIDDARQSGATIHALAPPIQHGRARCLPPVILTEVRDAMRVMREEIFGPILPLVSYDTLDEAIEYINARPHPLALYVFGKNRSNNERIIKKTVAGGVTVNDTLLHIAQDDLPFGGIGDSGMGAYHGRDGFNTFSKLKPIVYQARFNGMWLIQPPYEGRFSWMIRRLLR